MARKRLSTKNELIRLLIIGSATRTWIHDDLGFGLYPLFGSYYRKTLKDITSLSPSFIDSKCVEELSTLEHSEDYNDLQYIVFSAGWLANSEEEIKRVIPAAVASIGLNRDVYKCSLICALTMYRARNGANKRELYDYVCTEYKKKLKKNRWGEFNYSFSDMPICILNNTDEIAAQCIEDLLRFFEYDGLKPFDNSFKPEKLILRGLYMAYYGADSKWIQNYISDMFPRDKCFELAKKFTCIFDKVFEHRKASFKNQSDDVQWLKEYYEKCANRKRTSLDDEPLQKDMPKWLIALIVLLVVLIALWVAIRIAPWLIAFIVLLALVFIINSFGGSGVAPWSIIVYIALMLAVSIMEFNWLGWIFITLIFMSFVWKGGE